MGTSLVRLLKRSAITSMYLFPPEMLIGSPKMWKENDSRGAPAGTHWSPVVFLGNKIWLWAQVGNLRALF